MPAERTVNMQLRYYSAMETPEQLSARAARLLAEGKRLIELQTRDWSALNRLMVEAKAMRLSWIVGLCFAVEQMRAAVN